MAAVDLDKEIVPLLKLGKLLEYLEDREIDVSQIPTIDIICPSEAGNERRDFIFEMISVLHFNEICFFRILKDYGQNLELKIPKFYYGKEMTKEDSGMILMEDLSEKSSKETFTGLKFLTDEQIKQVITEICKIQVLGFQVDQLEEKVGKLEFFYSALIQYCKHYTSQLEELKLPFMTEERLQKVYKLANRTFMDRRNVSKNLNLPLVLIHDDLWRGNLIFNDDGNLESVVDFQVASPGCFAEDLANLLSMALPGKERRIKEKEYLEFYRNQLFDLLPDGNPEAKKLSKMTLEDLEKAYKECQKTALFHVIMTLMNYNSKNPGDSDSSETKLEEILRCLLEDIGF